MSKVFVGLSGGVDSSVAAALLKKQGHEVVGVYMKNWSRDIAGFKCPWQEDLASARLVAAHLQIPFKIYDFEKEYYQSVTQYLLDTYQKGQTPNPDVMCNQSIKFNVFYNQCCKDGAEFVATGHYARIVDKNLAVADDSTKDQTYFLYRMNPQIAKNIMFPLGDLKKPEVRKIAKQFNLPNFNRPDSQGLCFVGPVPMRDFLSEFIKPKTGDIVDENGKKLGEHNGAYAYTVGQRHGLGIGGGQPYFVYAIDTKKNIVYVTNDKESTLLNKVEFTINDCIWWQLPKESETNLKVRVRYRSKAITCTLHKINTTTWQVKLSRSEFAIAAGQSAVFYKDSIVFGGGIIC